MKGLGTHISKTLTTGSEVICDDNSGAKVVEIIGAFGWRGRRGRYPCVGIGDSVIVSVKKGVPEMKKKVERAVIIRQKKEIRRASGVRIQFDDNAVVLVDEQGLPKGTEIKGAVAREIAERFPKVAGIAAAVV